MERWDARPARGSCPPVRVIASPRARSPGPARRAACRRVLRLYSWMLAVVLVSWTAAALTHARPFLVPDRFLPYPPRFAPSPERLWWDHRLVTVTTTELWQKVSLVVSVERLQSDVTLWRRMHFSDWDRLSSRIRTPPLTRIVNRFRLELDSPRRWRAMEAHDWDEVPQPVRAMAVLGMVEMWSARYGVGSLYGVPRRDVVDTMRAIVMAESWFEHRAVTVNDEGNRDLGLAQTSDYTRAALAQLAADGAIDFTLGDRDYDNPLHSTRALAVWFDRMIDEADGDLDLAVRAYHRGIFAARRGAGAEYLVTVKRLRERFVRNQHAPPTWQFLYDRTIGATLHGPAGLH